MIGYHSTTPPFYPSPSALPSLAHQLSLPVTRKIYATSDLGDAAFNRLRERDGWQLEVHPSVEAPPVATILEKLRQGVDCLITTLRDPITADVLEEGAKHGLKMVAQVAVGYDNIVRAWRVIGREWGRGGGAPGHCGFFLLLLFLARAWCSESRELDLSRAHDQERNLPMRVFTRFPAPPPIPAFPPFLLLMSVFRAQTAPFARHRMLPLQRSSGSPFPTHREC